MSALPRLVEEEDGQYVIRVLWRGQDYEYPVTIGAVTNLAQDCVSAVSRRLRHPPAEPHPSDSDQPLPPR